MPPPLKPGWRWENGHFEFTQKSEKEDLSSGLTDQARTTAEFSKAMSSLVNYLEFEGEESGMFHNNRLPTLDTEIWWDEVSKNIKYSFYEKPMCPNIVIQKDTALSENCIRSSLVQEGVRRLLNCSGDLPVIEKQEILSKFASKMLNSKHSVESVKFMLVHSVTRYNEIIRRSNLNPVDPNYKPLHFDQNFKTHERKLSKFLALTNWYSNSELKPTKNWRSELPPEWKGSKPDQIKVPGYDFTTVLQCPSSKNGRLMKSLAKIEPRLTKSTGYAVKIVERGGRPLSKMFSTNLGSGKCERRKCKVCSDPDCKGSTLCQVKSVVYESVCKLCEKVHKSNPSTKHPGRYVGETYRTLSERVGEHFASLENWENGSFMLKHWALKHPDEMNPPLQIQGPKETQ